MFMKCFSMRNEWYVCNFNHKVLSYLIIMIYMHDEYVLNLSFYDLLNVNYIESYIKIAFEMFRDHKTFLESFKISRKANYVQKGREQAPTRLPQAASRLGTAQTWEQAASRLVTGFELFLLYFSFLLRCSFSLQNHE